MTRFRMGDRAKVVNHERAHYGWVGTVSRFLARRVRLDFDDGSQDLFFRKELRKVTKN